VSIRIETILREYRTKKSLVDTTMARIEAYCNVINNPTLVSEWLESPCGGELGMPRAKNNTSSVEREVCKKELTIETIKEWIAEDQARIFKTTIEVKQIETAMNALTKQEKYIIEFKYFERMCWKGIELNFNEQFRQQNYITDSGIKKINAQAMATLQTILTPFYSKIA